VLIHVATAPGSVPVNPGPSQFVEFFNLIIDFPCATQVGTTPLQAFAALTSPPATISVEMFNRTYTKV